MLTFKIISIDIKKQNILVNENLHLTYIVIPVLELLFITCACVATINTLRIYENSNTDQKLKYLI